MEMEQITKLIQEERDRQNPTLDIDAILKAAENTEDLDYLLNTTLKEISADIVRVFQELNTNPLKIATFCEKLVEYRYIDQIRYLHKGKHIRWIRYDKPDLLTNGGIVVDIKFLDAGIHILCKNGGRFIQFRYDDCVIFQKLSGDEQIILALR